MFVPESALEGMHPVFVSILSNGLVLGTIIAIAAEQMQLRKRNLTKSCHDAVKVEILSVYDMMSRERRAIDHEIIFNFRFYKCNACSCFRGIRGPWA